MSDARLVDLAKKVRDRLNTQAAAGAYSKTDADFTAAVNYKPVIDLRSIGTLRVTVAPHSDDLGIVSRGAKIEEASVDVAVQQKVACNSDGEPDPDEIEPLLYFVEELKEDLLGRQFATTPTARCLRLQNTPVYDPEHLHTKRVFTSVIMLTCSVQAR